MFSFKLRGAYNQIAHLSEATAERGVICASAGNHAQGVALAAQRRGIPAVIVMPQTTPQIKVQAVRRPRRRGGAAWRRLRQRVRARAGARARAQSGLRASVRRSGRDRRTGHDRRGDPAPDAAAMLDAIFVPVGGGGLIAGIAVYVKYLYPQRADHRCRAGRCREHVRVAAGPGKRVTLDRVGIFADGVAVKRVGEETFALCREHVDEIVLSTRTRSAPPSRTCSRTRARSSSRPVRSPWPGIKKYVAREGWQRQAAGRHQQRRQHELRSAAPRRRTRRSRRRARSAAGGDDSGAARAASCSFCETLGQRSVTEFNYRYAERARARRSSSASASRRGARSGMPWCASLRDARLRRHRHDRQRDGQAARALHGRRACARHRARGALSLRVSRSARARCCNSCRRSARAGTSACSTTATTARTMGGCSPGIQVPPRRARRLPAAPERAALRLRGGDRNPAYRMFLGA